MIRNLKALGLASVVMLAVSATAASAASANEEGHIVASNTAGNHVTSSFSGMDSAVDPLEFTFGEQTVTCGEDEFYGEITGGTTKQKTTNLRFWQCSAGGLPATIHTSGCHLTRFTYHTHSTFGIKWWDSSAAFSCAEETPGIQVTVFSSSSHTFRVCTITIPPQTGLSGITSFNNDEGEHHTLDLSINVTGITTTQQGLCGHQHSTASWHGSVSLSGEDAFGSPVDLAVKHTN